MLKTTLSLCIQNWGYGTCSFHQGHNQSKAQRKGEKYACFSLLLALSFPPGLLIGQNQPGACRQGAWKSSHHHCPTHWTGEGRKQAQVQPRD